MKHHRPAGPSQRQLRVGEQLRHIIADTLQRGHFHDESLMDAARITVTEVRVTPDLKNARAFIMPLGGEDIEHVIAGLNEAASYFQKEINRQSNLKFTPKVRFVNDPSYEQAERIETLLRNLPGTSDGKA